MGEENALFIPRSGLYRFAGVERVFVVKDGVAQSREVKAGLEDGEFVEIAEGLSDDENVIISAVDRLADGMKVQLQVTEAQ
jgi:hypothetical protein